ncbi:MAG TPA: 2-oxoglutarate dehydrogenase, E2 component, dihydrolipoamide succinyltransferase, partial [Micromonosporaceae bacterium]|nr:2-oxoglutarate dehydrogenase, E2 component, dihydrolipoamide succinyltransferase [Micromonosporaceae bacterium]
RVEADEPLLEVSTDKVDTEIPSPVSGTLIEIRVNQDETAQVGAPLAVVGEAAAVPQQSAPAPSREAASPSASPPRVQQTSPAASQLQPPQPAQPQPMPTKPAPSAAQPSGAAEQESNGYVTPLVRKLASEHGVDLTSIAGTGVGGRIRKQDVLDAAALQKAADEPQPEPTAPTPGTGPAVASARPAQVAVPSPLRGRTEKLSRMRQVIAKRMTEALHTAAQLTTVVEADVTRISRLRQRAKADFEARHGVKLSFLPFFTVATVEALRIHPQLNASIDTEAGTVTYHDAEHLGLAVDTDRGLMVPVIHNAGDLNLAGLARRIVDLAERTRAGNITPDEISGATFTLTNTGSRGALFDTPVFPQPQVGMLGTGAVVKRAVVVDDPQLGEIIVPRSMIYLALSYDHRLVDGADASRFLNTVKERLETANFEAELGLG